MPTSRTVQLSVLLEVQKPVFCESLYKFNILATLAVLYKVFTTVVGASSQRQMMCQGKCFRLRVHENQWSPTNTIGLTHSPSRNSLPSMRYTRPSER